VTGGLSAERCTGATLPGKLESRLTAFLTGACPEVLPDNHKPDEAIRRVVRQLAMEEIGKKPEVTVMVCRLAAG